MRFLIVLMILFSLWVCLAPFSHSETVKMANDIEKPETSAAANPAPQIGSWVEAVQGLQSPIATVRKTAEEAAKTVGRNLGDYIRGKVEQQRNMEMVQRFDQATAEGLAGFALPPEDRRRLVKRIEQAYIEDAGNKTFQLDQYHFYDLPNVLKKEYSLLTLERAESGTVDTFDLKGNLKTRWTVQHGKKEGAATTFYPDGEIHYIDIYENDRRVSRKKYDAEGQLVFEQQYSYTNTKSP